MNDPKTPLEYVSNYEYTCDKCKQTIKKNTVYYLVKRESHGIKEFVRVHKECPNIAGKCSGNTPDS